MNTKLVGDISEQYIAARLIEIGMSVLKPIGDNQRYDMVVENGGKFFRVQCKTANIVNGERIQFPVCSTYAHRGGTRKSYLGQVEVVIAYCAENRECYAIKIDDLTPKAAVTLRLTKPQRNTIYRPAEDFVLNADIFE